MGRSWRHTFDRLKGMSAHELFDRSRQYATARTDLVRFRSGNNFLLGPSRELTTVFGHFYFLPEQLPELIETLKNILPSSVEEIVLRAESICAHRFDLLGYKGLDYGSEIDWHCDLVHGKQAPRKPWFKIRYLDFEEVGDSKITWELNRHQHFVTLAKAYRLAGEARFAREVFVQWKHWHEQNPYPIGINWASSLEVAFRTLSWIWTFFLLGDTELFGENLRSQWLAALELNGRHIENHLSTYFSPNTHLLGEALALFSVGVLFPGFRSASRWQRRGWDILEKESAKQVRSDGFYFEQSTYYHVYALDMFLHARILAELNGMRVPASFDERLQRMLNVLLLLGRGGVVPSFGDDDGGRLFAPQRNRAEHMLDPLSTGAVLYQRGDFKFLAGDVREETLWLMGMKGVAKFDALPITEPTAVSTGLPDAGFYMLGDDDHGQMTIDAGPLGSANGGHGHADALSISLVRNGRSLLIDPGTFEYIGTGDERARFRGTGAHNTLQIDALNQAQSSGPFSWKTQPSVAVEKWITGKEFDFFQASHDGYSPLMHRRFVFHRKGSFWFVRDLVQGAGAHQLDISWHLGPSQLPANTKEMVFANQLDALALLTPENHGWSQSVRRDHWSPVYGQREWASVANFGAVVDLPADFATILVACDSSQKDFGRLVRSNDAVPDEVCAFQYSTMQRDDQLFFATSTAAWKARTWVSDADFLYWSQDRETGKFVLVVCNGSYVEANGYRVLTFSHQVSYAEVVGSGSQVQIFPSSEDLDQQSLSRGFTESGLFLPGSELKDTGV
jgi:hypothetical protein